MAASLSQHHRLNKKAGARATAATMRAGGHAKHMQKQLDIERDKRRSIVKERVAAVKAETRAQAQALAADTDGGENDVVDEHTDHDVAIAVDQTGSKLQHPAGEL